MTDIYKDRRFKESPWEQGADEAIAYTITVPTTWGTGTFTSITCALYEDPNVANTNRSLTMLTGSASSSGQTITTQKVTGLTVGYDYRLEVKFTTVEGNVLEAWGIIRCGR
jgi:hypothetical protein